MARSSFRYRGHVESYWSDQRQIEARVASVHDAGVALASKFLGAVGFKVFSLRFYVSCFLASATTIESVYSPVSQRQVGVTGLLTIWAFIATAFVVGLLVREAARRTERKHGPTLAISLAILQSVPVKEYQGDLDIRLVRPEEKNAITETVSHILKVAGEPARQRLARGGNSTSDENVLLNLMLWQHVQGSRALGRKLPQKHELPLMFDTHGQILSDWSRQKLDVLADINGSASKEEKNSL